MIEVRLATRDDVDALASLWPAVHDKHVRANPDYHKPLAPGAAVGLLAAIDGERPERGRPVQ